MIIANAILLGSRRGSSYSPEAQAVFDRMTGLTVNEKNAMAAFIDSQVASGNWDLLGCYQDYELQTFANARIDWKGNFDGEGSLISGITHSPGEGFVFAGTQARGYLTNYNTLTDAKWINNDALVGAYCNTNLSALDQRFLIGSPTLTIWQRTGASRIDFLSINGLTIQITSYPTGFTNNKHFTVIQSSNNVKGYEDSTLKNTSATLSPTESNATLYVGGRQDGATPFNGTIGCFYAGAGVDFDLANFITNRNIMREALFFSLDNLEYGDLEILHPSETFEEIKARRLRNYEIIEWNVDQGNPIILQ